MNECKCECCGTSVAYEDETYKILGGINYV